MEFLMNAAGLVLFLSGLFDGCTGKAGTKTADGAWCRWMGNLDCGDYNILCTGRGFIDCTGSKDSAGLQQVMRMVSNPFLKGLFSNRLEFSGKGQMNLQRLMNLVKSAGEEEEDGDLFSLFDDDFEGVSEDESSMTQHSSSQDLNFGLFPEDLPDRDKKADVIDEDEDFFSLFDAFAEVFREDSPKMQNTSSQDLNLGLFPGDLPRKDNGEGALATETDVINEWGLDFFFSERKHESAKVEKSDLDSSLILKSRGESKVKSGNNLLDQFLFQDNEENSTSFGSGIKYDISPYQKDLNILNSSSGGHFDPSADVLSKSSGDASEDFNKTNQEFQMVPKTSVVVEANTDDFSPRNSTENKEEKNPRKSQAKRSLQMRNPETNDDAILKSPLVSMGTIQKTHVVRQRTKSSGVVELQRRHELMLEMLNDFKRTHSFTTGHLSTEVAIKILAADILHKLHSTSSRTSRDVASELKKRIEGSLQTGTCRVFNLTCKQYPPLDSCSGIGIGGCIELGKLNIFGMSRFVIAASVIFLAVIGSSSILVALWIYRRFISRRVVPNEREVVEEEEEEEEEKEGEEEKEEEEVIVLVESGSNNVEKVPSSKWRGEFE